MYRSVRSLAVLRTQYFPFGVIAAVTYRNPALSFGAIVNQGVRLSKTPFEVRSAAPDQGVHTDEVLKEYGYSAADIEKFRKSSAI